MVAAAKNKPGKKKVEKVEVREIRYPDEEARVLKGEDALTAEQAKDVLGWITEDQYKEEQTQGMTPEEKEKSKVSFGGDFLFIDMEGNKVRCTNNSKNRPFTESWSKQIAQDILNKNWKLNGETVIIGKTGEVLSAQHRLIGLVLACQVWAGHGSLGGGKKVDQSAHWKELWETEPTIETVIVYGIDETPETTRTLDNVRKRTLSDVLYTDPEIQAFVKPKDREKFCKLLDSEVHALWVRTGAKESSTKGYQTHSEALDFIASHKRVLKSAKHVMGEYEQNWKGLSNEFRPGHAAAFMYLMGVCNSDIDTYLDAVRNDIKDLEKKLDFGTWDKAENFWTRFAKGDTALQVLKDCIKSLGGDGEGNGTPNERAALIINAWNVFVNDEDLTEEEVGLKDTDYKTDEEGNKTFKATPCIGGIDNATPAEEAEEEEEASVEEVEDGKVKARQKKEEEERKKLGLTNGEEVVEEEPEEVDESEEVVETPAPKKKVARKK